MMMPPADFCSSLTRRTTTRSPRGRNFMVCLLNAKGPSGIRLRVLVELFRLMGTQRERVPDLSPDMGSAEDIFKRREAHHRHRPRMKGGGTRPPFGGRGRRLDCSDVFVQRLILEIFVPSMLKPAISPSWSKMKA